MRQILLRAPKDTFEIVSPERTAERNLIGSNSGNLVFLAAMQRILSAPDVSIDVDRFRIQPGAAAAINERYDAYVIPLANAFRLSYEPHLRRMTELIRQLRIPVIIAGVGAQADIHYRTDRLERMEPAVRAFMSAVLDRSPSVGVRGELTRDYLVGLGFRDVEVIGCPSLFIHGDRLRIDKRVEALDRTSRISINVSPYVKAMGGIAVSHAERYPNLRYVAQDLATLELLLWGPAGAQPAADDPRPIHLSHPLLQDGRVAFFVDPWPWFDLLSKMDFSFGTRIHGNIAALIAGTPAVVLAHDSRTLELARYFDIPHRSMADVPADVDAAELYAWADFTKFNEGHAARWATFADFLGRNGLDHAFRSITTEGLDPDDGDPFLGRIADTAYPPAVTAASRLARSGIGWYTQRTRRRLRGIMRSSWARRVRVGVARARSRTVTAAADGGDDADPES
jgi:Polysaccharide pyruvyl transferase